ncbi:hypothetical protein [Cytophaga aurantiaca]|uniref:hypothetical protein n=1 Tax=Cytophaga aurantiaca TaxID=29530 RepID=UPI00037EE258|nr:hypothetical protein [Cytophaga aurantiaca]
MGTTQRISSGVKNEPNWGSLTSSTTSAAKTIENIQEKENEKESGTPEQIEKQAKQYANLIKRRDNHIKAIFDRLVRIGGGSKNISSGKSSAIGRAGLRSSKKMATFFSSAGVNGFESALKEIGFDSLTGKTVQNVIDYLITYCTKDAAVGMDETAANKAICEVLRSIEVNANDDLTNLNSLFSGFADDKMLSDILCNFFGVYIFEYLSERLEERISQIRGEAISKETFDLIKKDIMGRVARLNENRIISNVDWAGEEGKNEIEKIFDSIIKIEE